MRAPSSIIAHAQKLRSIKYPSSVPHNYPACCAQEMKAEINEYNILVDKAFRVEDDMQPEFNLMNFWRANEAVIPKFAFVLRAVLANSPNSIPPERVFSCLNNFFTPGHENSYSDYIEYATQLQFNHNQST